jgi:tRNA dimethylallyltransferase
VLIAGPTASGKSTLALALGEALHGTVINADAMQVYAELRVLTARPSVEDETRVPHLLYGHVPARERYSAGRYSDDAMRALGAARDAGRLPIFVGGTGLYFKVLTEGLSPIPPISAEVRARVRAKFDALGADRFFAEFAARDPDSAAQLRANDVQRVLRAADVLEATGWPLKRWQQRPGTPVLGPRIARFVVSPPRDVLYARIDARAKAMAEAGIDEARALQGLDPSLPAAKALGVPQLLRVLSGEIGFETGISEIQGETRRYAKRQLTWLRRFMKDWIWLEQSDLRHIISFMTEKIA